MIPILSFWPGLVILVDTILVTGMSVTPKAGNISCHWLATDAAQIHYSLGNTLKVKTLVQLDGLETIQHLCIFGRDL